jgi:hypothetical protein
VLVSEIQDIQGLYLCTQHYTFSLIFENQPHRGNEKYFFKESRLNGRKKLDWKDQEKIRSHPRGITWL